MRRLVGLAAFSLTLLGPAVAHAATKCHVPLAQWQPREALVDKLLAQGWEIEKIKTDDGCYKAYGRRADGTRVKVLYSPYDLSRVNEKIRKFQFKRQKAEADPLNVVVPPKE